MMLRSAARHRTTGRTDRLTPAARIAAAVELLEAVLASLVPLAGGEREGGGRLRTHSPLPLTPSREGRGSGGARPADAVANDFFRSRRFIGSGDRRAVGDRVWRVLRSYRRLSWWLGERQTPRLLVAASLLLEGSALRRTGRGTSPGPASHLRRLRRPSRRCCTGWMGARSSIRRCPTRCGWRCTDWLVTTSSRRRSCARCWSPRHWICASTF